MSASPPPSRRPVLIVAAFLGLLLVAIGAYLVRRPAPPGPGSPLFEDYVDAFQVAAGALDADVPQVAEEHLNRAVELIPKEPAGWANRGLLNLRMNRLPEAAHDLEQSQRLAPEDPRIQKLLGLLEQRRGDFGAAVLHLRKAIERDPDDVKSLYLLTQIIDQEHQAGSEAESQRLLEEILKKRPDNLRVLLELLKVAMRRGDPLAIRYSTSKLRELSSGWSERSRKHLEEFEKALTGKNPTEGTRTLLHFSNVLKAESAYPRSALEVSSPDALVGDPIDEFLWLPRVRHAPAPALVDATFVGSKPQNLLARPCQAVLPVWLTNENTPTVFVASDDELRQVNGDLVLPAFPVSAGGIVPIDWNNDLRTDLALAGASGLRLYQQQEDGTFADVTTESNLSEEILKGAYRTGFAADVDLDGDLDLLLSQAEGPPSFLRNNFDGTFQPAPIFADASGPQQFVWADFDHDGVGDAALLDSTGKLRVYFNDRSAQFTKASLPSEAGRFTAITVADAGDDGILDVVALTNGGGLLSFSVVEGRKGWDEHTLTQQVITAVDGPAQSRLIAADFDNNGAIDFLVSDSNQSAIWLGSGEGKFVRGAGQLPPRLTAAADLQGKGRIDLLGTDDSGQPVVVRNEGESPYHWQKIRPRASQNKGVSGDNRINSFGIGGEAELRTGTHVVKVPIAEPVIHFGLGKRTRADIVRLVWPNGTSQVEFNVPIDQAVVAEQRLKGSCPFLFAWNGERFDFVTDFMWSTPLGMYINATNPGGFVQTTDWVKVPGEQLRSRDGAYELRVNANLWETHYYDQMALMVVDHPQDTEIFVDERFFMDSATPAWHLTEPSQPIARATDHRQQDATEDVRETDGRYLDRAGRGKYQGITNDHWVEVELGDEAPTQGPVWLLARGWVHPTDSSVNYAIEQGRHDHPRAVVLEVPDGKGGWKVGRDRLGFPAGKNKTMLIRLDGIDGPEVMRHFRLRTNMEIYWDSIRYARGLDDSIPVQQTLVPQSADLTSRGIVAMSQANPGSPELPHYDKVVAHGQAWRDLVGYHTRFGEVGELLEKVDDRYAILTSGDEITLKFAIPEGPPSGWKRDFVWISDGWVKDGDFNTRFGNTVLPLPAHEQLSYNKVPGALEDDPVFQRHPDDWNVYHTRFISPHVYKQGLRPFRKGRSAGGN